MNKSDSNVHNDNFQASSVNNNVSTNEESQWLNGTGNSEMAPQSTIIPQNEHSTSVDSDNTFNHIGSESNSVVENPAKQFEIDCKPHNTIDLRNKILKWKASNVEFVRHNYNDHLLELFYLNHNSDMLDIKNWKKRPPEDVIEFCKRRRLEGDSYIERVLVPICVPSKPQVVSPLATPSVDMSAKPSRTISSSCLQISDSNSNSGTSQDQILEKARHEAYVMQRVGTLRKEGLWTEKRLPKVQEPPRVKTHWDYLLEEMVWLSADFAQERKWKKAAAKKCAKMVQKHFQDKTLQAQRAEKEQEMKLRKIAAFVAKEVRIFWSNIGKIVEYKVNTRLDAKKKKALDQHLNFIVDQTEKYSSMLAESMQKPTEVAPSVHSDSASRSSSMSDGEFEPNATSDDDEETICKEDDNPEEQASELKLLQMESEQTLEDILGVLPKEYFEEQEPAALTDSLCLTPEASNQEDEPMDSSLTNTEVDDEDFKAQESEEDIEDTIAEQEKVECNDYASEIKELEDENEMSLEELRKKYQMVPLETDEQSEEMNGESSCSSEELEQSTMDVEKLDSDDEEPTENTDDESDMFGLEDLMKEKFESPQKPSKEKSDEADKELENAAAVAESLQPKGFTLSSTMVTTPIPYLLKHNLREYQHVGLDWLVTMYEKKLNGILADEMGLGKTIQTISLLAHLACEKECWGPHLIVVPTSVMLNWEMELKKWCPAFKILTYYGSQKERKMKRQGWTKPNAFHICITSYKLVIQDHQSFRRKKWKYFILDEAQNIKNFKSQRWQLLLNFQTQRRLLLTGTPLQNNLMELWSLMHFLMPNIFASHREFREWFSNPVTGMIEGNKEYNDNIIRRLHKVLRPFILRRLKCEVEQQMPKKFEHIIMCRLSKRQRFLYEEFMSRTKTKETLSSGNFLSVINILMQLRKVCNHPNLFEPRPTVSPFMMNPVVYEIPSLIYSVCDYDPFKHVDLFCLNLMLVSLEFCLTAFAAHRIRRFQAPKKLIEEIDTLPDPPPKCPAGKIKLHVRPSSQSVPRATNSGQRPTAPVLTVKQVSNNNNSPSISNSGQFPQGVRFQLIQYGTSYKAYPLAPGSTGGMIMQQTPQGPRLVVPQRAAQTTNSQPAVSSTNSTATSTNLQLVHTSVGQLLLTSSPSGKSTNTTTSIGVSGTTAVALLQKLQHLKGMQGSVFTTGAGGRPVLRLSTPTTVRPNVQLTNSITTTAGSIPTPTVKFSSAPQTSLGIQRPMSTGISSQPSSNQSSPAGSPSKQIQPRIQTPETKDVWPSVRKESSKTIFYMAQMENELKQHRKDKLKILASQNTRHCHACPIYGSDLVEAVSVTLNDLKSAAMNKGSFQGQGLVHCRFAHQQPVHEYWDWTRHLDGLISRTVDHISNLECALKDFVFCVPSVMAPRMQLRVHHPPPSKLWAEQCREVILSKELSPLAAPLHPLITSTITQFPDPRLIQYDCGKLQTLDKLLRQLKVGNHRVLIFTQMTRMLDVFEMFLNYHGHLYLRLDGTTKVEQRQTLMERFNQDKRIFAFILSTRSGGIGVNLTGADTVIFYDSDWNPTMDAQAQDRCHRIGQTRDVHIYRLISEKTIEENILKKANQKRLLGDLAIEGGNFTTASLKKQTIHDLFDVDVQEQDASKRMSDVLKKSPDDVTAEASEEHGKIGAYESALAAAEDESDVEAAKTAKAEAAADLAEFDENIPLEEIEGEELSKAEQEVNLIMKQLNPIEKYALQFLEESDNALAAQEEKLSAEIEQQKKEWEQNRLQAMKEEEERLQQLNDDDLLSYSASDARNKVDDNLSDECTDASSSGDCESSRTKTPRTRSRGNVAIDLWTLDEKRLPVCGRKAHIREDSLDASVDSQNAMGVDDPILNGSYTGCDSETNINNSPILPMASESNLAVANGDGL